MLKIYLEKFDKNDLNSVKINVYKPNEGMPSFWNWLIRKDKYTSFDKNNLKLKLNAKDLQKLKDNGIDIQTLQNINNVRQCNQMDLLPKDKCLKESVKYNCVVPTSLRRGKTASKPKHSKKGSKSQSVVCVKSQNIVSHMARMKSHNRLPHTNVLFDDLQTNNLQNNMQRRNFVSVSPDKLVSSYNKRLVKLNNQHCKTKEKDLIPILLSKIKSMEEQINSIDSKTKQLNEAVSKQNALEVNSTKYDSRGKHSSQHNMKKTSVSHKVHSKTLKPFQKKKAMKKSKFVVSSSSNPFSPNDNDKGYPFEKIIGSLNNNTVSKDFTKQKTSFVNLFKNDANNFEKCPSFNNLQKTVIQSMIFGDKKSAIKPDEVLKLFCAHLEKNVFKNKPQETKTDGEQGLQKIERNFLPDFNVKSKPTFDWKHKSLLSSNNNKAREISRSVERDREESLNLPTVVENIGAQSPEVQPLNNRSIENLELKQFSNALSEKEPFQSIYMESKNTKQDKDVEISNNILEQNQFNQVKTQAAVVKGEISQNIIIDRHLDANSLMPCNTPELDNDYGNSVGLINEKLNMKKNTSEMIVTSDHNLTNLLQVDLKPTLKSQSSQTNSESLNVSVPNIPMQWCDTTHPNISHMNSTHSSCNGLETVPEYVSVSSAGMNNKDRGRCLNQNTIKDITTLRKEVAEPKFKITVMVKDSMKEMVSVKSDTIKNQERSKECNDFCNIHYGTLLKDKRDYCFNEKSNNNLLANSCYSLDEAQTNSATRGIENNFIKVIEIEPNYTLETLQSKNSMEECSFQLSSKGRYLYHKERVQNSQLYDTQSIYNFVDPLATKNMKNNTSLEINKFADIQESRKKGITTHGDFKYDSSKNEKRVHVKSENKVEALIRYISRKPSLMLNENEIEKLMSVQKDFCVDPFEGKQQFCRIIDEGETELNPPIVKCVTDNSKKRTFRCGLTLSEEPIYEESEDGKSDKDEHKSGDNFQIKGTKCELSRTIDTMTVNNNVCHPFLNTQNNPLPKWNIGRTSSGSFHHDGCVKTSSVFVQTDQSLIENTVNETRKQSVSIQTDIIMEKMAFFENKLIDDFGSCDVVPNGCKESKLMSSGVEEQPKFVVIQMTKENISELKLSDLLNSFVRDNGGSDGKETVCGTDPTSVFKLGNNAVNDTATLENSISSKDHITGTLEAHHQCTARCLLGFTDIDLPGTCVLDSELPAVLQDINTSAPESDGFDKGVKLNGDALGGSKKDQNCPIDMFCEDTSGKGKSRYQKKELNPNKSNLLQPKGFPTISKENS